VFTTGITMQPLVGPLRLNAVPLRTGGFGMERQPEGGGVGECGRASPRAATLGT
jgi:hypothetical protein